MQALGLEVLAADRTRNSRGLGKKCAILQWVRRPQTEKKKKATKKQKKSERLGEATLFCDTAWAKTSSLEFLA